MTISGDSAPRAGHDRPLTILIGALGGEGGGLLADWIVEAASAAGVLVQSTSIPGVAQRTGATTYYLEMMALPAGERRTPVFGLYPAPGHVDILVASELIEAGRAIESGFVTPDRTVLIASTHRVYAMSEKTAPGSGAFAGERVIAAARKLARDTVLADLEQHAGATGTALNALLLGAIAGTGLCPIGDDRFRDAIAARGVAVENNLRGFDAGRVLANEPPAHGGGQGEAAAAGPTAAAGGGLPDEVATLIALGRARLTEYQDAAYAQQYVDEIEGIVALDEARGGAARGHALSTSAARWLALWMSYEDVIRVADLKSRARRFARVRAETGAGDDEPVHVTEFLKPGIDELATVLPASLARRLVGWAERRNLRHRLNVPMHVRSDTIFGYLRLRAVAALRGLRRRGLRFSEEQALIAHWLETIKRSAELDYDLAVQAAETGRLVKGYSDTRVRAFAKLARLQNEIIAPALDGRMPAQMAASRLEEANRAALADEDGAALSAVIAAWQAADAGAARSASSRGAARTTEAAE